MAFCTSCGATVKGAFCQQCGTPLSAAASQPPVAQPAQPAMTPPAMAQPQYAAAAPVKRKTSPIVWILVAVAGLFLLGIVGLGVAGWYFARNPGLAIAKLVTAGNPNVEVLSTDMGSQTLRLRDKQTGKEITISFDDVKNGRFKFSATGDNGEVANVEIGGGGKLPSWVPTYPGATAEGNITAKGDGAEGLAEGGVVTFTTSDTPSQVTEFYNSKCKEMGMTVQTAQVTDTGGMVTGEDETGRRSLHVMVAASDGKTSMTVTYGRKR